MDKLAQEDHSNCPLLEEFDRYGKNWYNIEKSGRYAPVKLRPDFREALFNMHRFHYECGEDRLEPNLVINAKSGTRRLSHRVPHGGSWNIGGAVFFKSPRFLMSYRGQL